MFGVGDSVTITATAYSGYSFAGWYNGTTMASSSSSYTFTMGSSDITLKATWSYSDDFEFSDNGDGTISITSLKNKTITEVRIPTEYQGKQVTTISYKAFASTGLTSIYIPKTVTTVGKDIFGYCSNLTTIYCEAESKPTNWSGGWNRKYWYDDNNLYTVVWGVNGINDQTYENIYYVVGTLDGNQYIQIIGCDSSTSEIIIPDKINNIPVTVITNNAFRSKTNLETVVLPTSITTIGTNAFTGSDSIVIYCMDESKPSSWIDSWNCNRPVIWGYSGNKGTINNLKYSIVKLSGIDTVLITGCEKTATSVNIPAAIEGISNIVICESAFKNNTTITSIQISSGVKEIKDYAFNGCSKVTSLTMNEGVKTIGISSFNGCSSITTLTMPNSLTQIGESAFGNCSKLSSVTLSTGISTIPQACFSGCSSLKTINIPSNITTISYEAFASTGLTSIYIPKTVTTVGKDIFGYCSNLTTIYCEAESKPTNWSGGWNRKYWYDDNNLYTVVWGSKK